ncbi:hypothetical protein ZHAS_00017306 [Anopheles sinensis]|uniref:Uncharacterized protein n=1 Tax=Anopheles sinensis TaxID=74873 RepID=A0A084WG06_ANOSI|nr:hypothetical protein ZHAS_00017306 [Anopheles sinensis]
MASSGAAPLLPSAPAGPIHRLPLTSINHLSRTLLWLLPSILPAAHRALGSVVSQLSAFRASATRIVPFGSFRHPGGSILRESANGRLPGQLDR